MKNNIISTWAVYSNNEMARKMCSSGGVFYELSSYVLSYKGVVYGVAMDETLRFAKYRRITEMGQIEPLLSSKYLQAKVGDTFIKVKKDLEAGFLVLFSGTGCIINGLVSFLNRHYDKLICVDVICHGVPSPMIWSKYVDYIEKREKKRVTGVNFRYKGIGWEQFGLAKKNNGEVISFQTAGDDPYLQMFLRNYSLRPSCYHCRAKSTRHSDFSLGDFWGIDNVAPEMNDDKGTSLVIIRSEKGVMVFNSIKEHLTVKEVDYADAVKSNSAEYTSVIMPNDRSQFFEDAKHKAFSALAKTYTPLSTKQKIKRVLMNPPFRKLLVLWGGRKRKLRTVVCNGERLWK